MTLATLLCTVLASSGTTDSTPRNALSINPLNAYFGFFHVEYERAISDGIGLYVAPYRYEHGGGGGLTYGIRGWGLTAGARAYVFGTAPTGVFVGLEGNGSFLETRSWGGGAALWAGASGALGPVYLSAGVGAWASYDSANPLLSRNTLGVSPVLRLNIGAAF